MILLLKAEILELFLQVSFELIASELCLQSLFEVGTSFLAFYVDEKNELCRAISHKMLGFFIF